MEPAALADGRPCQNASGIRSSVPDHHCAPPRWGDRLGAAEFWRAPPAPVKRRSSP